MPTTNVQQRWANAATLTTAADLDDSGKLYLVSGSAVIEFDTETLRHRTLEGDEAARVRRWVERDRYMRTGAR